MRDLLCKTCRQQSRRCACNAKVIATWYRISNYGETIESFDIVEVTPGYVKFRELWSNRPFLTREKKNGQWFPSWDEAHAALVQRAQESVTYCADQLHRARTTLGMVKGLKP